jgi:3-oxoacyl-(acyl-carrier-protein) synthase
VSHGTGTPDNDKSEINTLKKIFPELPPFCSLKRTLGHTLAASGILETVLAIKMMQKSFIPPTAGFSIEDEQIGVSPAVAHQAPVKRVLKNAFGFGGNNAAIIFSAMEPVE